MPRKPAHNPHEPLGVHVEQFWPRDYAAPVGARKAGKFKAFVPAAIAGLEFAFGSNAVAGLSDATAALQRLKDDPLRRPTLTLARSLLRSESSASSRIEGKVSSQRSLARAAYDRASGRSGDPKAAEVLGNVDAMETAVELGSEARNVSEDDLLAIHRALLRFTVDAEIAGAVRTEQNWIGGDDYSPIGAVYVGPPPELVPELLGDLCSFINRTDLPAVAQAAIAHAQFENIHPFVDGNGRVGRAIIYAILRRRKCVLDEVPPISLLLAARQRNYIGGLGAFSSGDVSTWCKRFAEATTGACKGTARLAETIRTLQDEFLSRLGSLRSDSTGRQLINLIPEYPILDVPSMQRATGRSHVAVGNALTQLADAGVIQPLNGRRWGRAWECGELLDAIDDFERTMSQRA